MPDGRQINIELKRGGLTMAIFQRPFGQKNGNIMQASTGAEVTNDNPAIEDVGTGGIQWITERHVACVFLLDIFSLHVTQRSKIICIYSKRDNIQSSFVL